MPNTKTAASQPVVFLTGAGASQSLGKATTLDIYESKEFLEKFNTNPMSYLRDIHQFLSEQQKDGIVDLESLLDYVKHAQEWFDSLFELPHFSGRKNSMDDLRVAIGEGYEQILDFMIEYYGTIDRADAAALYEPFFDEIRRSSQLARGGIALFTLNYDEVVETAVDEMAGYQLIDGFSPGHPPTWRPAEFDRISTTGRTRSVCLFKLHGSVSWTKKAGSTRIEKKLDVPRRKPGIDHLVLYPTTEAKPISDEPFATGYARFETAIRRARVGVFIGTSFRDREVNDRIRARVHMKAPFTILAVGPDVTKREVRAALGVSQANVHTLRLKFEPRTAPSVVQAAAELLLAGRIE